MAHAVAFPDLQAPVSHRTRVSQIYHETRQPLGNNPVQSEYLVYHSPTTHGRSANMALFGFREYNGGLPTRSPHGNIQVALPISTVLQDEDDYLLPLKAFGQNGRLEQSFGSATNFHLEFLYVKAGSMSEIWQDIPVEWRQWVNGWRLRHHLYVRIYNGASTLSYYAKINGRTVWYHILVPYTIEFGQGLPVKQVLDTEKWGMGGQGIRSVTEVGTAIVASHLF